MPWRYQPVIFADPDGTTIHGMISVHFDGNSDALAHSSEPFSAPGGESHEDMVGEMANMWMSAMCWKSVAMSDLSSGMEFERAVDQKTRNNLAAMIERSGNLLRLQ